MTVRGKSQFNHSRQQEITQFVAEPSLRVSMVTCLLGKLRRTASWKEEVHLDALRVQLHFCTREEV